MKGKSNYREMGAEKDQFYFDIISEDDNEYTCLLLQEYQDKFQNGHETFKLRKCLFGDKEILYSLVEEKTEQLNLFDFTY